MLACFHRLVKLVGEAIVEALMRGLFLRLRVEYAEEGAEAGFEAADDGARFLLFSRLASHGDQLLLRVDERRVLLEEALALQVRALRLRARPVRRVVDVPLNSILNSFVLLEALDVRECHWIPLGYNRRVQVLLADVSKGRLLELRVEAGRDGSTAGAGELGLEVRHRIRRLLVDVLGPNEQGQGPGPRLPPEGVVERPV